MLSFTLWQKQDTSPRLYVTPNTPGKAYIALTKGISGEPRVVTTNTDEYFLISNDLSSSGLGVNSIYQSFNEFVQALQAAGHTVHSNARKPNPAPARYYSQQDQKAEYSNTKTPKEISHDTLNYSLQSIKFLNPKSHYTITVDTREPESLLDMFRTSGINVVSNKLDQGDILITSSQAPNELLIERKTTSDLYSSIIAKTAHRQSEALFEYQQRRLEEGINVMVVWLIEGELDGSRMLYNAFPSTTQTDGVVNYFAAIMGQHLVQCFNQHHLCYLAVKLAQGSIERELVYKVDAAERKSRSDAGKYHGVRTSDKQTLMQLLMAVPSIKEPVAKAIIAKGHRFSDILKYTHSDWQAFDGVGKVLAQKILGELSEI